jgi:copper chaperone NosL
MIVDEPRCASALRTRSGESILFDDLGCMLVWRQAHPESEIAVGWVHDFESGRWIDLATATFVIETRFDTPMASNILAATDSSRATAIAARRGGRPTDLAGATAAALARASHR